MDIALFLVVVVAVTAAVAQHQKQTGESGLWERVWAPAGRRVAAAMGRRRS